MAPDALPAGGPGGGEPPGDRPDRRAVTIVEVGPRDGLQNEERVLPTADKLELIGRALAAGVRRVEVASLVNPTRVPQMADAEAVIAGLPGVIAGLPDSAGGAGVAPVALVLNRRGLDRALEAGIGEINGEINYVVGVTDGFSRANQGMTTKESLAAWAEVAAAAQAAGVRAGVTLSVAFGCPFDGEVPAGRLADVAAEALEGRPHELTLGDTIGVGVPSQVTDLVARVRALPGADKVALRCHFHNTRNTGLANAYAAYTCGVRILDASAGGFGGCPFAPEATGNIPTEDLAWMLHRMGAPTGLELRALVETAAWLGGRLGRPVPALLGRAGIFPSAT